MTDIQLAILIRQYHKRLSGAIEALELQLPDDMKRVEKNRLIPAFGDVEWFPATAPLREIILELEESANLLGKTSCPSSQS